MLLDFFFIFSGFMKDEGKEVLDKEQKKQHRKRFDKDDLWPNYRVFSPDTMVAVGWYTRGTAQLDHVYMYVWFVMLANNYVIPSCTFKYQSIRYSKCTSES